jgi:biopolymer transport protein TolR
MAMGLHTPGSGRSRRGATARRAPMAEINVTPFVDVMLVLLIIFMVTAPLLTTGVPIDLPDSRAKPLDQDQRPPVQISLDADGSLYIDDAQTSLAALPDELAVIADGQGDNPRTINLRADRGLAYGRVMQVMGELNRAGLTRVSLVTTGSAPEAQAPRADPAPLPVTGGSDGEP